MYTMNTHHNKSGDDQDKLVADDWLNTVQISNTELDGKLARARVHIHNTADGVIWLQSANPYHSTSEYNIGVS